MSFLGSFNTAEEAATAYARSEYGRADAAKLLQPRPAPTAAGAEVIRQAEREGLTLTASSSNSTGYKGVYTSRIFFISLSKYRSRGRGKFLPSGGSLRPRLALQKAKSFLFASGPPAR